MDCRLASGSSSVMVCMFLERAAKELLWFCAKDVSHTGWSVGSAFCTSPAQQETTRGELNCRLFLTSIRQEASNLFALGCQFFRSCSCFINMCSYLGEHKQWPSCGPSSPVGTRNGRLIHQFPIRLLDLFDKRNSWCVCLT